MRGEPAAYIDSMTNNTTTQWSEAEHPRQQGRFADKPHTDVDEAVLASLTSSEFRDYDELDYWAQVTAAEDPNVGPEFLQHVLDTQSEDDHYIRVAKHQNATPAILEQASRHSSGPVQTTVIANRNTSLETLVRLRDEASDEVRDGMARMEREGRHPGSEQTKWEAFMAARRVEFATKVWLDRH